MLEYKINDEIVKYKNTLSEAEYLTVIETAIDAYRDGLGGNLDMLGVVDYNPIKAQQAFYRALFGMLIENYDSDKYDLYFSNGLQYELLNNVINAKNALETINDIIKNSMNISMVLNKALSGLLNLMNEKLPDGVDMAKVLKKFPKDLAKALEQYTEVMTPSKSEFDKKVQNGDYKELEKNKE